MKRKDERYDICIVGCGPSAIGLIYGLLLPYINDAKSVKESPPLRIAIIERGSSETSVCEDVKDPKRWYRAAHPSSPNVLSGTGALSGLKKIIQKHFHKTKKSCNEASSECQTTPQKGLNNRILSVPTGKNVGGGTNINACLVVKPPMDDFKHWPQYWKQSTVEHIHEQDLDIVTKDSRIVKAIFHVENELRRYGALTQESWDLDGNFSTFSSEGDRLRSNNFDGTSNCPQAWIENETVFKNDIDVENSLLFGTVTNAAKEIGVGLYERVNYFDGILRNRLNESPELSNMLEFFTSVSAVKVVTTKDPHHGIVATGVECMSSNNETNSAKTSFVVHGTYIVLCTGAIHSPSLLLSSGIGSEAELLHVGIKPLLSGPNNKWNGVGKRLVDHVVVAKAFFSLKTPLFFSRHNVNSVKGWIPVLMRNENEDENHITKALIKPVSSCASNLILPSIIGGFFRRKYLGKSLKAVFFTILFGFLQICTYYFLRVLFTCPVVYTFFQKHTYQYLLCLMNPRSKGRVYLHRSENSGVIETKIDPAYLKEPSDNARILYLWRQFEFLVPKKLRDGIELLPGMTYRLLFGPSAIPKYISDFALPYYHWSGTCAMKTKRLRFDYVVDEKLGVRDVRSLFVCDSSIFPEIPSVPPSLTLLGLGFAFSDIMRRKL